MNMRARTLTIVTAHTNIITQVLLVAMAVASMDHRRIHRGIDAVLNDMRQHPVAVVSTVLVIVFVRIRLLLHCRHEEGDKPGAAIATAASSMALW